MSLPSPKGYWIGPAILCNWLIINGLRLVHNIVLLSKKSRVEVQLLWIGMHGSIHGGMHSGKAGKVFPASETVDHEDGILGPTLEPTAYATVSVRLIDHPPANIFGSERIYCDHRARGRGHGVPYGSEESVHDSCDSIGPGVGVRSLCRWSRIRRACRQRLYGNAGLGLGIDHIWCTSW